jgi:hypothetical protein
VAGAVGAAIPRVVELVALAVRIGGDVVVLQVTCLGGLRQKGIEPRRLAGDLLQLRQKMLLVERGQLCVLVGIEAGRFEFVDLGGEVAHGRNHAAVLRQVGHRIPGGFEERLDLNLA